MHLVRVHPNAGQELARQRRPTASRTLVPTKTPACIVPTTARMAVSGDVLADSLRQPEGSLTSLPQDEYESRGVMAADIVFSPEGRTAYLVASDAFVHNLDGDTMSRLGAAVPYTPSSSHRDWRKRGTRAASGPDGRFLVIGTAD